MDERRTYLELIRLVKKQSFETTNNFLYDLAHMSISDFKVKYPGRENHLVEILEEFACAASEVCLESYNEQLNSQ